MRPVDFAEIERVRYQRRVEPGAALIAVQALSTSLSPFAYVLGYFVAAFVVLDTLPLTVIRPNLWG